MNNDMNKVRHRFNIIDFFVIIIILAVALSLVARKGITTIVSSAQDDTTIEYTLLIENVNQYYANSFTAGDQLKLSSSDAALGTVTAVSVAPYESYVQMGNGTLKKSVIPDYYSVTLNVECKGSSTEEGLKLNGNSFIAAGMSMYVYNQNCSVNSIVMKAGEAAITNVTTD